MSNLEVKGYRVGYKAVNCGDRHFTMEKVKTYDEAMNKIKKWENNGWQTKIMPII